MTKVFLQKVVFVTLSETKGLDSSVASLPQNDRNLKAYARDSKVNPFFSLSNIFREIFFCLKNSKLETQIPCLNP